MEAKFKTIDGLQTLEIEARTDNEKLMLYEFLQKEIPGYDHSLIYTAKKGESGELLQLAFHPTLSNNNIGKEGIKSITRLSRGHITLEINDMSFKYHLFDNISNEAVERGVLKHIYHLRKMLARMNGYAGNIHE